MDHIQLIAGLGNPGREYQQMRHNAGFWWVEAIAARKRARWSKESKFSGWIAKIEEEGRQFWLLKPATYMNESGRSVAAFLRFYRIEPAAMLVVHDELDLAPGVVKLKKGGGTGGHNGLADIVETLATKDFWRLRIGIGHPGHKDLVSDYVLHEARREEQAAIDPEFERSLDLLPRLASGRLTDAMTWLHTKPKALSVESEAKAPDERSSAAEGDKGQPPVAPLKPRKTP